MKLTPSQALFLNEAAQPFGCDPFSFEWVKLHPTLLSVLVQKGLIEFDEGSECWRATDLGEEIINKLIPF